MADKAQPKNLAAAAQSAAPTNRPLAEASTHSVAGAPTPSSAPSLAPGSLLGPYRLQEKLGEGGMGAVYKAVHEHLDKVIAIKVLPATLTQQADAVARFRQEMKAVGKVEHPNIVRAMDAGEIGGIHYLAMEYVEGTDLTHYIKTKGPMSIPNACRVIRQAALGLAAAHAAGLVHRDIKPSNLLAAKTGQIKLLDLGLARLASDTVQQTHNLTAAGQTFGTPDYMAPEQWDDAHGVDGRTDLYALGCTLCFLLTGHAPFDADKSRSLIGKMQAHVSQSPPDLRTLVPGIPEELAVLFEKLLTKKREDRLPTATALAEALLPFTKATSSADPASAASSSSLKQSPAGIADEFPQPFPSIRNLDRKPKSKRAQPGLPKWLFPVAGGAGALLLAGIIIVITKRDGTTVKIPVEQGDKVEIVADDTPPSSSAKDATANDETPLVPPWDPMKTPDYAKERAVAEWVLSVGGTATVSDSKQVSRIVSKLPLPDGDFIVTRIDLIGNPRVTDADIVRFQSLARLQEVSLVRNRQITDAGVAELATISSLMQISLQETTVTDVGLGKLVHLPQLRNLTLTQTSVTDDGIKLLTAAERVKTLYLGGIPVSIQGLRALRNLPLMELHIPFTQVRYSDLPEIASLFRELQHFDGRSLKGDVGAGLLPLAELAGLNKNSTSSKRCQAAWG